MQLFEALVYTRASSYLLVVVTREHRVLQPGLRPAGQPRVRLGHPEHGRHVSASTVSLSYLSRVSNADWGKFSRSLLEARKYFFSRFLVLAGMVTLCSRTWLMNSASWAAVTCSQSERVAVVT